MNITLRTYRTKPTKACGVAACLQRCDCKSIQQLSVLSSSFENMSVERRPSSCVTLPRTERGTFTALKGDPKGKNFLYTNRNDVIIRDIENPEICDVYSKHAKDVRVAAYAPSGFYIASGDSSGSIHIWDTTQHILKYEYQPLSGAIKDIAWSPDSKRVAVAGEGREKAAHVFLWDSGSSVGNLQGHSGFVNAVDYKPTRPFRICTASEDRSVGFFEGPPFKYKLNDHSHTNFVNCVKYSPDGAHFVSGGADGRIIVFNGVTGEKVSTLGGDKAHNGGIYGLSWSSDSKFLLSASGDKTAKIWDIEANTSTVVFTFGDQVEDQQLGCLWQGDYLLTVSLSANINYLDRNKPSSPRKIIQGHSKNIMCMAYSRDDSRLYTGSYDGRICQWNPEKGEAKIFQGKGHKAQVTDMAMSGLTLATCSMDDTVRLTSTKSLEYGSDSMALNSQPQGIASGKDGLLVVASLKDIVVIRDGRSVFSLPVEFEAHCVSIHPGQSEVAVGGPSNDVVIYTLDNHTLVKKTTIRVNAGGRVSAVAYSPDGAHLAIGSANRTVDVYDTTNYQSSARLGGHVARVASVAWSPDSRHIASGGVDRYLIVWTLSKPQDRKIIRGAHSQNISKVAWLDNDTVASTGHDCFVRFWSITHS